MNLSLEQSQSNYENTKKELESRENYDYKNLVLKKRIQGYLDAVREKFPEEYDFFVTLQEQLPNDFFSGSTELYITIPCVGFGSQETENIVQTVELLKKESVYKEGKANIIIFVNRPEDEIPDETYLLLRERYAQEKQIGIIDGNIKSSYGRTDGVFANEMATSGNQVPIGFIRDSLIYTLLLGRRKLGINNDPILFQMDGDFFGFARGSLQNILEKFKDNDLNFLQAGSDWEGTIKTKSIPGLQFGSDLMYNLPVGLKTMYNKSNNIMEMTEILFCDGIQRGIQVPQAQKVTNFLNTGGYGLTRLAHDELDLNLRMSYFIDPTKIKFDNDLILNRDNRRAVASYMNYGNPPISQWNNTGFNANDSVREKQNFKGFCVDFTRDELTRILNCNLDRYFVPQVLGQRKNIIKTLNTLGIAIDSLFIPINKRGIGVGYKCLAIGEKDFTSLSQIYEQ